MSSISYFTALSGTSMYESWIYSVYNIILGLPIIVYGIMNHDVPEWFALEHPAVRLLTIIEYDDIVLNS
jgi:hypothetical protein